MTGCTRSLDPCRKSCLVEAEEGQAGGEGELKVYVDAHAELGNDLNEAWRLRLSVVTFDGGAETFEL